ncbi:hypothetical protein PIB30_066591, partial [Stylosanthes scabra]|nr:hypothetical protein [Stylosanthes scabra]
MPSLTRLNLGSQAKCMHVNHSFSSSLVTLDWTLPAAGAIKLNCDASRMQNIDAI